MPARKAKIETELRDGVLVARVTGTLHQGDMPTFFMENSGLFTDRGIIWDLRDCVVGSFTYEESKRNLNVMYTRVKMEGVTRIALVCTESGSFGIRRMLEGICGVRDFPARVRTFRDMAEAEAWVRAQDGD